MDIRWRSCTSKTRLLKFIDELDSRINSITSSPSKYTDFFSENTIIRGMFLDKRTLRAISLKTKMFLTLLSNAYALWKESTEVKNLLGFHTNNDYWNKDFIWQPEDVLCVRTEIIPFIHNDYIQPSVKFIDTLCNGISTDFIDYMLLSENNLICWNDLEIDVTNFIKLDFLKFLNDITDRMLIETNAQPLICFAVEKNKRISKIDILISYFTEAGFKCFINEPCEITGEEGYNVIISTLENDNQIIEDETGLYSGFLHYMKQKKVINPPGPRPVFCRGIFELFSDKKYEAHLGYPPGETLERMIPWTRILSERFTTSKNNEKIDLIDYVLKFKDMLIIRSNTDKQNNEIVYGESTPPGIWEEKVKNSLLLPSSFIVQEKTAKSITRLPVMRKDLSWEMFNCSLDLMLNERGDIGGIGARLSPVDNENSSNANCATSSINKASVVIAQLD